MNDPEASQDYTADPVMTLDDQHSLSQSFVSRRPNFNSITIWVTRVPGSIPDASLENANILSVKLLSSPTDPIPVFSTSIVLPATGDKIPITVALPIQNNAAGKSYTLDLSNSFGTIQVNGRLEDIYPLGQAYANDQPIDADIAFRLSYDYDLTTLVSDIRGALPDMWLALPLLVELWLPGWLMLEFSGLRRFYDFGEQTALSTGLSLALVPVFMLWTSILKIKWTSGGIYFAAGFLVAIFLVRLVYLFVFTHNRLEKKNTDSSDGDVSLSTKPRRIAAGDLIGLALCVVFLASLAVRLIMVRDLATPAWVDSVHHALLTRLIMESGSYPSTYQPYLDIAASVYHPGFHSIAAVFTWLSRLNLDRSLLILGQVLNALSVFSVYLLARTLTRSSLAALFAAIITGFFTPMPAYYTSWGRYTELTGLLLLPVVLALLRPWIDSLNGKRTTWVIILGALTGGGLFMIHYRVLAFLVCLILSFIIFQLLRRSEGRWYRPGRLLWLISAMGALAILLVIPWFIQTFKTNLLPYVTTTITSTVPLFQDFSWSFLTSAFGKQAMVIAGLGLAWGLVQRKRFTYILILWVILLFLLANLAVFKLPGGGLISNASVEIMLFIPISILAGYFAEQVMTQWIPLVPSRLLVPSLVIANILVGFAAYLGARQLVPILNPVTILSRSADLRAMDWIDQNILPGQTIVINPFAWGYGLYAGNDGGYWISPLTGKLSLPPPVLYGLGPDAPKISDLSQQVINLNPDPASFWEFLHTHQLHYVYVGARGGVISPQKLANSNLFTPLYHQAGVWIFSTKP